MQLAKIHHVKSVTQDTLWLDSNRLLKKRDSDLIDEYFSKRY